MARRTRASIVVLFLGGLAGAVRGQGSALCSLDDVNGDGVRDLALASREEGSPSGLWILSGKDGSVVHAWAAAKSTEGLPHELVQLGDLDRNGARDLGLVTRGGLEASDTGKTWRFESTGEPCLLALSSTSGQVVRRFALSMGIRSFVRATTDAGDWNHDGTPDVAVGLVSWSSVEGNRVLVYSGADGAQLWEHRGDSLLSSSSDLFGAALLAPGDVDGDGTADLIVGAPFRYQADGLRVPGAAELPRIEPPEARDERRLSRPDTDVGAVILLSGRTGERVAAAWGDRPGDEFGANLALIGDIDGDGRQEFAAAATHRYVRVLSFDSEQRTFRIVQTLGSRGGYAIADGFGTSISAVGDLDGDGRVDLVVAAHEDGDPELFDEGYAQTYSSATGKKLTLLAQSRSEGVDACSLGDFDRDGTPEVALTLIPIRTPRSGSPGQLVRVVNAKDGKKVVWERTIASLRAAPAPQPK